MKKRILIYAYLYKRLEDLIFFSKHLENEFDIIFIAKDVQYESLLKEHDRNFRSLYNGVNFLKRLLVEQYLSSLAIRKFLVLIKSSSLGQYLNELVLRMSIKYYEEIANKILKQEEIDLFITINDRYLRAEEAGLFRSAKQYNIPIFLPYLIKWNADTNLNLIQNNEKYILTDSSTRYQKSVFKKYFTTQYKGHFFYQAYQLKVLTDLGIISKNPWLNGGGASDIVALPDEQSFNEHVALGIDSYKLKILGDISYINLFNTYTNKAIEKKRFKQKYNLEGKKIVLIALGNWWEHNIISKAEHFRIIQETIEACLVLPKEFDIVISLHPSMKKEHYVFLEEKYNLCIAQERLMQVIALCDLYVAYESTTVSWAVLCGIKTVITRNDYYNVYMYKDFTTITYTENKPQLEQALVDSQREQCDFKHDWLLLSKEKVFNSSILKNYIDEMKKLLGLKDEK